MATYVLIERSFYSHRFGLNMLVRL